MAELSSSNVDSSSDRGVGGDGAQIGNGSTGTEPGPPPAKKWKGIRCMVGGCNTTAADDLGLAVHRMPGNIPPEGERFSPLQKKWIDFIGRKRVFNTHDARNRKAIAVCSGHFLMNDYDVSQTQKYRFNITKTHPRLKKDAFPTIDQTTPPFPPSWFINAEEPEPMETTSSSVPTPAPSPSTTPKVSIPVPSTALSSSTSHSHARPPPPVLTTRPRPRAMEVQKQRRKSFMPTLARKKEVEAISVEYAKIAEEERAQEIAEDILQRSKGEQCSVKMVNHRVGHRGERRSCKLQVKPRTVSKGVQVSISEKPATVPMIQYSDAASQTVQDRNDEESDTEGEDDDDSDGIEIEDDERNDPTYDPLGSDEEVEPMNQTTSDASNTSQPPDVWKEEKFIVFESKLHELFRTCENCLLRSVKVNKIRPKCYGSQLKMIAVCQSCNHVREWHSQPKIGNVMAGNLLLSAAILYGGASPTKVLRVLTHMNLQVISTKAFMDHQRVYLQPAIIQVAKREQHALLSAIQAGKKLIIGGDGRSDSPGHSAKFGSYTFMDMETKKVIDVQLVQSTEVSSSNAMEKEGLARGLASLHEKGLVVGTLVTDRHAQIAKWMRETYPEIDHRYDVWHIAKGIKKKVTAVSKLKDCELAGKWKRAIVAHVYYSAASTPDGNGELMVAKFQSLENHIRNIHEHESPLYPRCAHADDYPAREWMKAGTKVYEKLTQEVMKTRLLNDMKKMSPFDQTSSVEAFHSVILYWCPKMLSFSYSGMKCRLYLAQMHWNENADRGQALKTDGTPRYKISYPKAKAGGHTVSPVLKSCTFRYVEALMEETLLIVSKKDKLRPAMEELQEKPALCSQAERPNKADAVMALETHRRFADRR